MKRVIAFLGSLLIMITVQAQTVEFVKVLDGFRFTEGPVMDSDGNLYFTEIPESLIHMYTPEGELSVYLENTGGANGLYFDKQGRMVACAGGDREITRYDSEGNKVVLLDNFDDKKLNSPNDLWIDPDGGIYFTDPRYGSEENMELDGMDVYYFHPDKKKVVKVIDDMKKPNGIIGTSDGKTLYVVDNGTREFFRYTIKRPGKLDDKTLLYEDGTDGVSIDDQGNIYITASNALLKYNPRAGTFRRMPLEVNPTNVLWHDGELWITCHEGEVWKGTE